MNKLICAVAMVVVWSAQSDIISLDVHCPGADSAELDPYCSIQTGLNAASDGDEVIVAPRT